MTTTTCIVIPADRQQPVATKELASTEVHAYREIMSGATLLLDLDRPESTLYVNAHGRRDGLPHNPRATTILWAHNSAFRGGDLLFGDVLLAGPAGPEGNDLPVPDELTDLLLGPGPFTFEVQTDNENRWHGNDNRFHDVHRAYAAGVGLAQRWPRVREVRVVRDYPMLIEQWLALGRRNPWLRHAANPPFTRESFVRCSTLAELEERIDSVNHSLGTAFYYRDLCLINQTNGRDEWLCIRSFTDEEDTTISIAFDVFTFAPLIHRGDFASIVRRLLAASKKECQRLQY